MTDNAVPGRTQSFAYDHLKRITSANTQATSGSDCWGQSFTRDRYNNLTNITVSQCSAPALSVVVNATTNHITSYSYDSAGHVTNDGVNTYTWDGEHRLSSAAGVNYTYDGLGRRVQKSSGEMSWYDARGHLLAETDSSGNLTNEYIYFGGRRIARREASGTVLYYFNDNGGTNRAMTNATGVVQQMSEYYPTGGEKLLVGTISNPLKFSGNKLDTETGLYATPGAYQPTTGSVLSPVAASSGPSANPQNLNPYAGGMSGSFNSSGLAGIAAGYAGNRGVDPFEGAECMADDACYSASTGGTVITVSVTTYGGNVAAPGNASDTGNQASNADQSNAAGNQGSTGVDLSPSHLTIQGGSTFIPFSFSGDGGVLLTFDSQDYLTGFSVTVNGAGSDLNLSLPDGTMTMPANTSVGVQWLSDDSVQFGFTNPVLIAPSGTFFNGYFSQATYSDEGDGSYTSAMGAPAIGNIPLGNTTSLSGTLMNFVFNSSGDVGNDLSNLGNTLISLMNNLHDNVTGANAYLVVPLIVSTVSSIGGPPRGSGP